MRKTKHYFNILAILCCFMPSLLYSQTLIHHTNPESNLQQRWDWAVKEARNLSSARGYWIGYSIERFMGERSFIGTFRSKPQAGEVVLSEILFGQKPATMPEVKSEQEQVRDYAQRVLDNLENKRKLETKILKQVGILIQMPAKKSAMHDVAAIKYSNLSLRFDLENLPVLWLGESNDAESIALLQKIYTASDSSILKARAVSAIGLHDSDDLVMPHLREFALHGEASKIRKEAIYRLSQRNNDQVLPILEKAAFNDKQHAVQKEAVYRISNKKSAQSFAILKKIATTHKVRSLRKEAIYRFSLRKNTPQTSEFLLEIVFNDPDRSLQKEALYRLTLLRPEQSTQLLIKIAETHATASIRKEAIYRLGRKKHPKAKKVFIELLEER